ncbi:MAG: hypothetical protein LBT45_02015 [Rickettsiales bacterium]|jgi:hypothetical protein|nr:hypothetical protein [Rickettsiales bacterium]
MELAYLRWQKRKDELKNKIALKTMTEHDWREFGDINLALFELKKAAEERRNSKS